MTVVLVCFLGLGANFWLKTFPKWRAVFSCSRRLKPSNKKRWDKMMILEKK